jgi:Domain of unknown function (DUF4062)
MADVPQAMISSTTRDLPRHRQHALDACLRQGFLPKMMEHLPPSSDDAVQLSLNLVDEADVYVLILGLRYGEIPDGYDKSYTHLEFDRAVERKIPILALLSADDHVFAASEMDLGVAGEKILTFRDQVRKRGVGLFSGDEDMRSKLIHGLSSIRPRLEQRRAPSPHYAHQPDPPPAPFVAHPYTLLETAGVVGRQQELDVLTDWVSDRETPVFSHRMLVVVAIGGMGKSAVAWKWFQDIAPQELPALAGRIWWSFYETDATFENFVLRTLAYVTGRPAEELSCLRPPEREHALLAVLNRAPYLVVLDGLERLLLAYSRPDAARLADDDLDEQAANWVAGARGLPASAATSFTGQTRLRLTADPRVGAFLKRLAPVQATRVLVTSRLYPRELQTVTMEPVPGAFPYFLRGLAPNDAVQLWRRLGGSGSRAELVELFAAFDNYPLLIRALAGEVARFRRAPGDLGAWRRANPGFNPFRLPLVQRKSHVLEYALGGLTAENQRILHTIAAFRAPKDYDTLAALLVGDGQPCATEVELDRALAELEDRGLLGWDRRANRYDLHPVVRGVAWAGLDSDAKQGIDLRLAAHFGSIPAIDARAVDCVDDLTVPTELYHTLLRLGRYKDAFDLLDDRLVGPLFGIRAFRQLAELGGAASGTDPSWLESIKDEDDRIKFAGRASTLIGIGYQFAGDPLRASQGYDALMSALSDLTDRGKQQGNQVTRVKALRALTLCQLGRLADAEREAREAMAHDDKDGASVSLKTLALGSVLLRRGRSEDGRAWLTDYRAPLGEQGGLFKWTALWEFGWVALSAGDGDSAGWCLARMDELAAQELRGGPAGVSAMILRGALARRGHSDRAGELLNDALLASRSLGLGQAEVVALTELAGWHLDGGRMAQAREHVRDAIELADRAELRLCWADSLNTLCRIEFAAGDRAAAVAAARAAHQQAWCDGPPFSYEQALVDARTNLVMLAEPEPVELPHHVPTGSDVAISIRPLPPLRNNLWFREHGWPEPDWAADDPIATIKRVGWHAADNATFAALAARIVAPEGADVRIRLLAAETFEPAVRLACAVWLSWGEYPEAGPALSDLLRCPNRDVRAGAVAELARNLAPEDRRLLTAGLDGRGPLLELSEAISAHRIQRAISITEEPVDAVWQRYERLADTFGVPMTPPNDAPPTEGIDTSSEA